MGHRRKYSTQTLKHTATGQDVEMIRDSGAVSVSVTMQGTGGYWWVLAMLWEVFEAHVVGRAWWIDNACGTGALIGALIRPADLVNLEGLRTLS